ncbi:MAG: hypothetical protein ACJ0J7_05125 [Tepidiformaceae bacterium]
MYKRKAYLYAYDGNGRRSTGVRSGRTPPRYGFTDTAKGTDPGRHSLDNVPSGTGPNHRDCLTATHRGRPRQSRPLRMALHRLHAELDALVPIVGKLSDIYGRKPFILAGIIIFVTGSCCVVQQRI